MLAALVILICQLPNTPNSPNLPQDTLPTRPIGRGCGPTAPARPPKIGHLGVLGASGGFLSRNYSRIAPVVYDFITISGPSLFSMLVVEGPSENFKWRELDSSLIPAFPRLAPPVSLQGGADDDR